MALRHARQVTCRPSKVSVCVLGGMASPRTAGVSRVRRIFFRRPPGSYHASRVRIAARASQEVPTARAPRVVCGLLSGNALNVRRGNTLRMGIIMGNACLAPRASTVQVGRLYANLATRGMSRRPWLRSAPRVRQDS